MGDDNEYLKLSVEDQCVHKLWKARVNGYEQAVKVFQRQTDEKSPEFSKYLGLVKKFVVDSNAVAQEKGLDAVQAFLDKAAVAPRTCGEVSSGVIAKCLNSSRTRTKEKGIKILLTYIELEKQEAVQEELLKQMGNKQPKIVTACLLVLRLALSSFGNKVVPLKPVVKAIPGLFSHSDKGVREETKLLAVEAYRWIGAALKPAIQSVKPVVLKELEEEFEKLPAKPPKPTRFLKSQQALRAQAEAEGDGSDEQDGSEVEEEESPAAEIDPFELVDPVEILSKLPKDFYENLEAKKWQQRKGALDAVEPLANNPKIEPGDFGDLVRALKKVLAKDSNVMLVAQAGRCLCGLAKGLRKRFQPYASQCIQVVLEKFKEKKPAVVTALRDGIDAMFLSTKLESIMEDVQAALDSKNPSVRMETASFLARCLRQCTLQTLPKAVLKPLAAALAKKMDDTTPDVRNAAAEALGTALRVVGEGPMTTFLADMDHIKVEKIKECAEKVELVYTRGVAKKAAKPSGTAAKPSAKRLTATSASAAPKKPAAAQPGKRPGTAPGGSRPKTGKAAAKSKGKSGGGSKAAPPMNSEPMLSEEQVSERAEVILPGPLREQLVSSNWKERLAAMEEFSRLIEKTEKKDLEVQVMVKVLGRKPGWKETNFQVLKAKFGLVKMLAEKGKFSWKSALCVINGLVDKIGDTKLGATSQDTLSSVAEACTLGSVSLEAITYAIEEQKNPKNQSETCLWLASALKEFGFSTLNIKAYIGPIKKSLGAVNPQVRSSAVTLIGVMHLYMGAPLRTLFEDEKPTLLQQIDAEIESMSGESLPKPTRGLKKGGAGGGNLGVGDQDGEDDGDEEEEEEAEAAGGGVALDDLVPRTDIGPLITPQLVEELRDTKWKVRGEALEKIQGILNSAKFITSNLGDLPTPLNARLADNNRNLVVTTANIMQKIAEAMGPSCFKYAKTFGPGLMNICTDNKVAVRTAARNALDTWAGLVGMNPFLEDEILSAALSKENPNLRIELYGWLEVQLLKCRSLSLADLAQVLPLLYTALEDRNAEVRKKAQAAVPSFMYHLTYEKMAKAATKLKPGSKDQVMDILEKQRANVPEKPGKAKSKGASAKSRKAEPTTIDESSSVPTAAAAPAQTTSRPKTAPAKSKGSGAGKKAAATGGTAKSKGGGEEEAGAPLVASNKERRLKDEKDLKVLKWNFSTPRDEYVEQLKEQMQDGFSKAVLVQLFHSDFKQHIAALNALSQCIETSPEPVVSNSDLLLKWASLRFFDTNTSVILKLVEFLNALFNMLSTTEGTLTDSEANSFVPYLINKVGDPKEAVRQEVRKIIKLVAKVYPMSKLFVFIMNGLQSKNARQRTECLEELGCMIETHGITVCQPTPPKALKEIAGQISDRDNNVRSAALNTLVKAYQIVGETVYKYIGNLSDKDQSLLEERIKRSGKRPAATSAPKREEGKPTAASASTAAASKQDNRRSGLPNPAKNPPATQQEKRPATAPSGVPIKRDFSLDLDTLEKDRDESSEKLELFESSEVDELLKQPVKLPEKRRSNARPALMARLARAAGASTTIEMIISQVASNDLNVSIHALAQLDKMMKSEDKFLMMVPHVDQTLVVVSLQLRMAYTKYMGDTESPGQVILRLYRCLLACPLTLFENRALGVKVSKEVIRDLVHSLLTVMLDERLVTTFDDGPQIIRSVNVLLVKVLENSNPGHVIGGLTKLLQDSISSDTCSPKFLDLSMKCLWRMIRQIPKVIGDIDLDRVLLDIHVCLKNFPANAWKDKNNTPFRTIKTLIHTLVKATGEEILEHFTMIEEPSESELRLYIQKILKSTPGQPTSSSTTSSNKPSSTPSKKVSALEAKSSAERADGTSQAPTDNKNEAHSTSEFSRRQQLPPSKANDALSDIFKKIASKENTREGLSQLYDFKKRHPDVNIEPYLKRSSTFFQNYIERGLKNIDMERDSQQQPGPAPHLPTGTTSKMAASSQEDMQGGDLSSMGENNNGGNSEEEVPPHILMDRLKVLRARCGLAENTGQESRLPVTMASKKTALPQASMETGGNPPSISLGTSSSIPPPSQSSGGTLTQPASGSTETNVADLKRRLEAIKRATKR